MSSVSGIVSRPADAGSSRVIPQTRRADGTLRKERKIRDGYTPPEDVTKYANEKVATTARLAPGEVIGYTPPANKPSDKTKAQRKNEKKKAKKAETKSSTVQESETVSSPPPPPQQQQNEQEEPETQVTDPVKKLKNLRKKLRQAEQLKAKLDAGETLLAEQLEKIDKMEELTNEIAQLEVR